MICPHCGNETGDPKRGEFPEGLAPPEEIGMPKNYDSIIKRFAELGHSNPETQAKAFLAYYGSTGWIDKNGQKIKNWWMACTRFKKESGGFKSTIERLEPPPNPRKRSDYD